jgi:cytochrome P450
MSRPFPPGPSWPTGVQTLAWVTRPKPFLRRAHDRYGDVFTVRLRSGENFVMFAHPDAVKEIFTGDPEVFRAGEGNRAIASLVGSSSILLLDGAEHLRTRRLMLPPFHGERMQRYGQIIAEAAGREFTTWQPGERVEVARRMQEVTLEVIMRAVFGVEHRLGMAELRERLLKTLDWFTSPRAMLGFMVRGPARWGTWPALREALRPMDEALLREVASRRAAPDLEQREDILSLLMQARYEDGSAMSDAELRDQLVTLLVAGHETTATALGWAIERLLRHPEALRLAREDAEDGDGEYLDAVCKETLRLRPVLPVVARRLAEPRTVAGVDLPAGADLAPCIYLVHHRPDVYEDPYAFRPERFLGVQPGTYTWLPFGGSVRRCLGATFALFEMQVVLRTLLRAKRLRAVDPASERTARRTVTLVPERGAEAIAA